MKKIVLCGSTRFAREFDLWNSFFTLCGLLVYSVGVKVHAGQPVSEQQKNLLDKVHLDKIAESDAVFVIDQSIDFPFLYKAWQAVEAKAKLEPSYVGFSTAREIELAKKLAKPIWYASKWDWASLIAGSPGDAVAAFKIVFPGFNNLELHT